MLLYSFGVLILGTNAFNTYIHQQENNTLRIDKDSRIELMRDEYEKARSDKKDERVLEEAIHYVEHNNLILEIARLTRIVKKHGEE